MANPQVGLAGDLANLVTVQNVNEKGVANGYASLDGSGLVPSAQLPAGSGVASLNALTGALTIVAGANITVTPSGSTITIAGSGSSGVAWTQVVNESGASFANWTAVTGSWSSDGTQIKVNGGTGATFLYAKLTAKLRQGPALVYQADLLFDSSSVSAVNQIGGLLCRWNGLSSGIIGFGVRMRGANNTPASNGNLDAEQAGVLNWKTFAQNFTADAYHTLRLVVAGESIDIFLDGTYIGSAMGAVGSNPSTIGGGEASFLGLYAFNGKWQFKNIAAYTLGLP